MCDNLDQQDHLRGCCTNLTWEFITNLNDYTVSWNAEKEIEKDLAQSLQEGK